MKEILDDIDRREKNVPKKLFSILSFSFSLATLVLFVITFIKIGSHINPDETYPTRPQVGFIRAVQICCFLGVVFAITSLVRKEKIRYIKAIGAVLNFLLFALIIGLVIFAAILDMNR